MADVETRLLPVDGLKKHVADIFEKLGVRRRDAEITADVLVTSDQRGIPSHGVARLKRYVDGIRRGVMVPDAEIEVLRETQTTLLVSGHDGLGQPVSYYTMEMVIDKAKKNGLAVAAVRDSNHFGIAAYYSMMALPHNLIGISMTNAAPLVVPTNGKDLFFGTNPISVAVPTKDEPAWVLDMATSTVPRGKLEVYARQGKKIPLMWATDEHGVPTDDPSTVLQNLLDRKGGGLLPLGGGEELTGGHKGYGLAVMVDILSGVLSGGAYGLDVYGRGKDKPANVCHFFAAIDPQLFIPLEQFTAAMDDYIRRLKAAPKAKGKDRIWVHGEKEWEKQTQNAQTVPIEVKVIETMKKITEEVGLEFPF